MKSARFIVDRIYTDSEYASKIAPDVFPVSISYRQGTLLSHIIDTYKPKCIVELGFRYGISSLWIQSARHTPKTHIIIDPYHHSPVPPRSFIVDEFIKNQKGVVFEEHLMSQEYLAALSARREHIDMVFVDASQWFDSVMTDMFFISRLLHIGGIVIVRNLHNIPVRKAIMFYLRNLPYDVEGVSVWKNWVVKRVPFIGELMLRLISRPTGFVVLRLTGHDRRITEDLWRHFISF